MKAFISYSHQDENHLLELSKHLSVLRDEGAIDDWYDRKIMPGDDLDDEISLQLEGCQLFIPLVSHNFLDSDYCRNREMKRAFERYENHEVVVVPVIVEPCDWQNSPLGALKALPKDGKPVSLWDNENSAYSNVVSGIRLLLESQATNLTPSVSLPLSEYETPTPFRVQRDFDEIDRADFRERCFLVIEDYFREMTAQFDSMDGFRGQFRDLSSSSFSCTVLNQSKNGGESNITVHAGNMSLGFGDITYSFSANASANTANGWMTVESDGYELRLKWNDFGSAAQNSYVTPQSASELLWKSFARQAGIEYD